MKILHFTALEDKAYDDFMGLFSICFQNIGAGVIFNEVIRRYCLNSAEPLVIFKTGFIFINFLAVIRFSKRSFKTLCSY